MYIYKSICIYIEILSSAKVFPYELRLLIAIDILNPISYDKLALL